MQWTKLVDFQEEFVPRGTLLKFNAAYPFEDIVIMMVCEGPSRESSKKGLITITGYKAGINPYVMFPDDVTLKGLTVKWLIENWNIWVWPDFSVKDVLVHMPLNANGI